MKLSVIVPHRPGEPTLPRALKSLETAAAGLDVEFLIQEDSLLRGPSWARNRALDRASGDLVYFCDADDEVKEGFFRVPMETVGRTGAEMCFFTFTGCPGYHVGIDDGVEAVRERYLPAFFGYSFDDVRRWYRGGRLGARKQLGQVWRCAYDRRFLEANRIRFDENMTFYEDAAFLSHCAAFARKAVSIADDLYTYHPGPSGNLATGSGSLRHWEYKFHAHEFRKRLDALTGGKVWRYCEASPVLSAAEMMRLWKSAGLSRRRYREEMRRYLADAHAAASLKAFPLSWRHPLVALAVNRLRIGF
jgi:glycosyltransferase involved in cell wall biosynthesis